MPAEHYILESDDALPVVYRTFAEASEAFHERVRSRPRQPVALIRETDTGQRERVMAYGRRSRDPR